MNSSQLSRVVLRGFKSIRECDLSLGALNVLIGPNGAGKSNLVLFLRLVQQIVGRNLQLFAGKQGGPDALLHFGRKRTERLSAELHWGSDGYGFALEATKDNRMIFASERHWSDACGIHSTRGGYFESTLEDTAAAELPAFSAMRRWSVYHFHDTGDAAMMKGRHGINDNLFLRPDARNLAAFLFLMQNRYAIHYERLVRVIRLVAPFFGDFLLRPAPDNEEQIEIEWTERGESTPFKAHLLSDGTLRFICLATVLMQPEEFLPETIMIDEPELGLHPFAINLLASLIRSLSSKKQILVSTQSADLLSEFEPENAIVADRLDGATVFRRLDAAPLAEWLEEYSLGELWKKNLLGGRPSR